MWNGSFLSFTVLSLGRSTPNLPCVTCIFGLGGWTLFLWHSGSVLWAQLPCSMWGLSSWARDQTHIPCITRQILNHWITREVPAVFKILEIKPGGPVVPKGGNKGSPNDQLSSLCLKNVQAMEHGGRSQAEPGGVLCWRDRAGSLGTPPWQSSQYRVLGSRELQAELGKSAEVSASIRQNMRVRTWPGADGRTAPGTHAWPGRVVPTSWAGELRKSWLRFCLSGGDSLAWD